MYATPALFYNLLARTLPTIYTCIYLPVQFAQLVLMLGHEVSAVLLRGANLSLVHPDQKGVVDDP